MIPLSTSSDEISLSACGRSWPIAHDSPARKPRSAGIALVIDVSPNPKVAWAHDVFGNAVATVSSEATASRTSTAPGMSRSAPATTNFAAAVVMLTFSPNLHGPDRFRFAQA
jgi:hypothetical protein